MKVFIACLGTETNTFSPIPTGLQTFEETMLFHGDATRHKGFIFSEPLRLWRQRAEARGDEVVESIAAFAQPAGPTIRSVYEGFRDELLGDLERALPVDMVLLCMHGAMVADGYDDCEGDILTRVRALVGADTAVGAELDLHCSITPEMTAAADVLVTFKEYPHIDFNERADELFALCLAQAEGRHRPVMATADARIIGTWRTTEEPTQSFVSRMKALEGRDGILSVSFAHGFPWGDVPYASAKLLVVADGDRDRAQALADRLAREVWEMREEAAPEYLPLDRAMGKVQEANAWPVVLADVADNAGGGAPSDSTFVLRELLDRGVSDFVTGIYWDPIAVRFCQEAGEGASLDLRLGGKCSEASGDPVDLRVTVRRILADARQSFGAATAAMGTAVWVRADGDIDLVLNTIRTQTFHPDAFTQFGIELTERNLIVVKSSQHFHAGFAPIAGEIVYTAAGGALDTNFAALPYRKFTDPYWPRVADPFAAARN